MRLRIAHVAILWTVVCAATWALAPRVELERITSAPTGDVQNPLVLPSDPGKYKISGVMNVRGGARNWYLRADDCITRVTIGGTLTHESKCEPCLHCDRSRFPLPANLTSGSHPFEVEVENSFGGTFLEFSTSRFLNLELFGLWAFGLALVFLSRRWKLRREIAAVLLLGMALGTAYLEATGPRERSYDVDGHLEYVRHMIEKGELPRIDQAWETYQTPLYYVAAVIWTKATAPFFPGIKMEVGLQRLAWLAFLATLLISGFCWSELEKLSGRRVHWVGAVLVAGLPAHVFLASRVNNDVLLPLFGALSLAGALGFLNRGKVPWLALAAGSAALGLIVKLSGVSLALFGLIALILGPVSVRKHLRNWALIVVPPALALFSWELWSWITIHQLFYDRMWNLDENLRVPNTAYRWLSFDFKGYLDSPSADSRNGPIRLSFPTFFVTSALQGEFPLIKGHLGLLTFLRASFLPVLAAVPVAIWISGKSLWKKKEWLLLGIPVGVAILLAGYYGAKGSYSCAQDFRFCAAVFVPLGLLIGLGFSELAKTRRGMWFARGFATLFSILLAVTYKLIVF